MIRTSTSLLTMTDRPGLPFLLLLQMVIQRDGENPVVVRHLAEHLLHADEAPMVEFYLEHASVFEHDAFVQMPVLPHMIEQTGHMPALRPTRPPAFSWSRFLPTPPPGIMTSLSSKAKIACGSWSSTLVSSTNIFFIVSPPGVGISFKGIHSEARIRQTSLIKRVQHLERSGGEYEELAGVPAMVLCLLATGCDTVARNETSPSPQNDNRVRAQQSAPQKKPISNPKQVSAHLEEFGARRAGVKGAHCVVFENTAIVGIDVDGNMDRSRVGTIKYAVAEAFRKDPYGIDAIVTADIDISHRLTEIGSGYSAGQPDRRLRRRDGGHHRPDRSADPTGRKPMTGGSVAKAQQKLNIDHKQQSVCFQMKPHKTQKA